MADSIESIDNKIKALQLEKIKIIKKRINDNNKYYEQYINLFNSQFGSEEISSDILINKVKKYFNDTGIIYDFQKGKLIKFFKDLENKDFFNVNYLLQIERLSKYLYMKYCILHEKEL
jgi:hypothetical protein